MSKLILITLFSLLIFTLSAQVLISPTPGSPETSAMLEVKSSNKGLLIPRMTTLERDAISGSAKGLLIYNSETSMFNYFNGSDWIELQSGDEQWGYDAANNRVYLKAATEVRDSLYYDKSSGRMMHFDTSIYYNSAGLELPISVFEGQQTLLMHSKTDSLKTRNLFAFYNVDTTLRDFNEYGNIQTSTVVPKFMGRKVNIMNSISSFVSHSGRDTVQSMSGITNVTQMNGSGTTLSMRGFSNQVSLLDTVLNKAANISGIRNLLTGRSTNESAYSVGSIVGIETFISNIRVSGRATGLNIGPVNSSLTNSNNYAIFTSQGANRFGDSTVISTSASTPRAILDINDNSAMIIPSGTVAFRPTGVLGMLRHNTTELSPEIFDGFRWKGVVTSQNDSVAINKFNGTPRAILDINDTTAMIIPAGSATARPTTTYQGMLRYNNTVSQMEYHDGLRWRTNLKASLTFGSFPALAANTITSASLTITGAQTSDAVIVNSTELPVGAFIKTAYVSSVNTVTVQFENRTAASITLPSGGGTIRFTVIP